MTGETAGAATGLEQRLSIVTLGVRDLAASIRFFEGLGWRRSLPELTGVAFFQTPGVVFGLYPRDKLAEDAGVADDGGAFTAISLAYNVRAKEDVAPSLAAAERLGATIVKPAQDVFWGGHHGYFRDLDGHLWEVAWNPGLTITDDGAAVIGG